MTIQGSHGINYKKSYGTAPSVPQFKQLDRGADGSGEYLYCKANGAITQYDCVVISATGTATAITTVVASTTPKTVGFAQIAAADQEFLWIWVGKGGGTGMGIKGRVATLYVANTKLYTTATAGVLDDTVTAGVITGVVGLTTDAGGGSAVELFAWGYINCNL